MKRYSLFYLRGHEGEMETDLNGEWVKYEDARCQIAEVTRERNSAHQALNNIRRAGYNTTQWATWAQRTAAWGVAPDMWPMQPADAPAEDTRIQLAEVTRERDTALAALGELQAAAADMLAAADALLKERDNYRAVCVLASALRNKERGS